MSGGSLIYVYCRVNDAASTIRSRGTTPLHHAFAAHLTGVSEALRAIESMFSGDTAAGSEEKSIREIIRPGAEIEAATARAHEALADLRRALSA